MSYIKIASAYVKIKPFTFCRCVTCSSTDLPHLLLNPLNMPPPSTPEHTEILMKAGASAALVGESLIRSIDSGEMIKKLKHLPC
jgi:hypothetical protein